MKPVTCFKADEPGKPWRAGRQKGRYARLLSKGLYFESNLARAFNPN